MMWYFWVTVIVAAAVFLLSRHFYNRRIIKLRHSHDSTTDDFRKAITTSEIERENFETMLSSMVEAVIVIDAQGKIVQASPNFYQLLELRSKETQNKLYWEVIWNQQINDSIREALAQKKALRKQINIIGPRESFFSMQISPVMGRNQKLLSLIVVFHDITELKKLEKLRAEFVANVSHELKTPLTSIKGFIETIKTSAKDDPDDLARFLNIIEHQTVRLENLVNDLLILSSIESQEVKLDIAAESLEKMVDSALALCKKRIDEKGHRVMVEIPKGLPRILADRRRMEQLFLNLMDNAVKFTPAGGLISITARPDNRCVCVEVRDNGMGIAPEHLSRVFERFYRVDKARSQEAGGTGLGLSIVHQIVSAHRGKIEVESAPGSGSTFRIFLPCQS